MGIRYYGWAITDDEAAEAKTDPWPVIRRADHRHHEPGWTNTDFDKAWRLMQGLFSPDWPSSVRPGYELVAGDVTYPNDCLGYEPHVGVIPCDRVPVIARDVASVLPLDVRQFFSGLCYDDEQRRLDEQDYVAYYVGVARTFTADAADRGQGIIYMIG